MMDFDVTQRVKSESIQINGRSLIMSNRNSFIQSISLSELSIKLTLN